MFRNRRDAVWQQLQEVEKEKDQVCTIILTIGTIGTSRHESQAIAMSIAGPFQVIPKVKTNLAL